MKARRIDFSPGDWIGGTLGMSLEEEGLYIRLVARIYSFGEMLDADPAKLARLCSVRPQVMRRLLGRLKLLGKFHETGGKLVSNRCETELKLAQNRLDIARFNGSKGGRPKDLEKPDGFSAGLATSTTTTNIIEEEIASAISPPCPPSGGDGKERANVGSKSRGTRLPVDWQPGGEASRFAETLGLDAGRTADEFGDYWHAVAGPRGVKLDWEATWRNWCRRAAEDHARKGNGSMRPGGGGPADSPILRAASRVRLPARLPRVD